ncbi:histone-lysine N-methyltransferase EHMT1-like [Hemicordylus capensis]|uniref:histone-lysine N-methyltransferase EHMT1-like n=1 Tax=Hemicordylus capensis TaxID=884348 RepID=UPI00230302DA|nr:histone-lysine N-methyltransferase EHMT1-like [Hemicordylus capensis]
MGLSESKSLGPSRAMPKRQKESLHVAARKGHYDTALCLISQRMRVVNKQDASGRTPLFWATEYRHEKLVELLLSHGADVAARDHEGNLCLHWAAFVGSAPIARRLLEAGSDVNAQNHQGDSPLHLAAQERSYQCLVLFLAQGAKVFLPNKDGQTPLQCAKPNSPAWRAMQDAASLPPGPEERILSRDISQGFEGVPIPCLNGVDQDPCPRDFHYVTQDILSNYEGLSTTDLLRTQHCECSRTCSMSNCPCVQRSRRTWYTLDGQLVPTSAREAERGYVYECHVLCWCAKSCPNRVVQKGLRIQLQLYKTLEKGWGIRTVQDLPRGTFICQYFGELLPDTEIEQREEDTYHYVMETEDGQYYYLDGRFYSGVGRFMNHACEPNVIPLRVCVGHEIPGIAFFTHRAIQAGEELGFNYGSSYWEVKGPHACKCYSPKCRFPPPPRDAGGDSGLESGGSSSSSRRPLRGFALKSKRKNPLRVITRSRRAQQQARAALMEAGPPQPGEEAEGASRPPPPPPAAEASPDAEGRSRGPD